MHAPGFLVVLRDVHMALALPLQSHLQSVAGLQSSERLTFQLHHHPCTHTCIHTCKGEHASPPAAPVGRATSARPVASVALAITLATTPASTSARMSTPAPRPHLLAPRQARVLPRLLLLQPPLLAQLGGLHEHDHCKWSSRIVVGWV
eukprot:365196-Chlamydomonas_euryale.AAC.2